MISSSDTHDPPLQHGIRANLGQFSQQLIQVFFVGATIGLQRTVIPALAEQEFGVPANSATLLMLFIVSFGFVKGTMNLVAGRLSEQAGRRRILIWGWIVALPIPFMILYGPTWAWIVAANVLLGVNQGFAWSMTVTSKVDITRPEQRGLATGLNEFAGYTGVALAGIATGYLATSFDPRLTLFTFGFATISIGLVSALLFSKETLPWAHAEAAGHATGTPRFAPRFPTNVSAKPSLVEIFLLVSVRNRTLSALSQAGCVEKFVDALVWGILPVYLYSQAVTVVEIGWVVGVYGVIWGASQLWTGPLSDAIGRKPLIVAGMWTCSAGVAALIVVDGVAHWSVAAAITGVGMAMLYPTLIAAVSDISHPNWRGTSLGVYRFWRDSGYAIGALLIGVVVDLTNNTPAAFWFTALAMGLSGFWVFFAAEETHPRINSMVSQKEPTVKRNSQN